MQRKRTSRIASLLLLTVLAFAGACSQIGFHPGITRAQAQQFTGTVINLCGTISAFTASTASAAGSVTVKENNVSSTYGIPAGTTFTGLTADSVGQDVCLTGVINGANSLLTATTKSNVPQSGTVCGPMGQYTPAALPTLGMLSIAGLVYPVAYGTTITGPTTTGANVCIALTFNALGQVTAGVSQVNTTTIPSGLPVQLCGTVTAYTAPTSSAPGSITFNTGTVLPTYTLPAGVTIVGSSAITVGQSFCFLGVIGTNNTITATFTITSNITTAAVVCGALTGYRGPTATSLGFITLGATTLFLAYNTFPTGDLLILQGGTCITGTLNGLGQLSAVSVRDVTLPTGTVTPTVTATVTPTATATPLATNTPVLVPSPPSLGTATPTSTPASSPTSTSTPTNTAIPTDTPIPPTASFISVGVKYKTVRIGTKQILSARAEFAGRQKIVVTVYFATGLSTTFHSHTNSKGVWTASFTVPRDTISRYSSLAVVTFALSKNHTTARDFTTFHVTR